MTVICLLQNVMLIRHNTKKQINPDYQVKKIIIYLYGV